MKIRIADVRLDLVLIAWCFCEMEIAMDLVVACRTVELTANLLRLECAKYLNMGFALLSAIVSRPGLKDCCIRWDVNI